LVAVPSAEAVAAHLAKPNKIESLNLAEASAPITPGTTASEQSKFETTQLFVGYVGMVTDPVTLGRPTM
jgi:predicted PhzF superfamily epimerase YddE/YHI9